MATANEWSAHIGLREVPTIEAKTIGKVRRRDSSSDSAPAGGVTCTAMLAQRASDRRGWALFYFRCSRARAAAALGCPCVFAIRFSSHPAVCLDFSACASLLSADSVLLVQMGLKGTRGLRIGQSQQGGGGGRGGGGRGGGQQQGGGGRGGYGGGQGRGGYGGGQGRPQSARY